MKLFNGWKIFINKCGGFYYKPVIRRRTIKLKQHTYQFSILFLNIVLTYESWEDNGI